MLDIGDRLGRVDAAFKQSGRVEESAFALGWTDAQGIDESVGLAWHTVALGVDQRAVGSLDDPQLVAPVIDDLAQLLKLFG